MLLTERASARDPALALFGASRYPKGESASTNIALAVSARRLWMKRGFVTPATRGRNPNMQAAERSRILLVVADALVVFVALRV